MACLGTVLKHLSFDVKMLSTYVRFLGRRQTVKEANVNFGKEVFKENATATYAATNSICSTEVNPGKPWGVHWTKRVLIKSMVKSILRCFCCFCRRKQVGENVVIFFSTAKSVQSFFGTNLINIDEWPWSYHQMGRSLAKTATTITEGNTEILSTVLIFTKILIATITTTPYKTTEYNWWFWKILNTFLLSYERPNH